MTAAFNEFMRQYQMTGSAKADGYSRDAFIGLDGHEKQTVFDLLSKELPFSAEWLFFLDREKALPIIKDLEEKLRKDAYTHVYILQEELINNTGDLDYQVHMIEDYAHYTNRLKPRVVSAVSRTPQNAVTVAFYKQVILTETNEDAVTMAVSELLSTLRVPRGTDVEKEHFNRLASELKDAGTDHKLSAFKKLSKYEPS